MSQPKLSNIPVKKFRKYLEKAGLKQMTNTKGRGGHEKWTRSDLDRPITFQNHISPVPEFIVLQILRHLKVTRKEFWEVYQKL